MMRQLSLAHLTAIDQPPPALIEAAAEARFDAVGLRLQRVTDDSPGYPLMDDPLALRQTRKALQDTGITVNDIEFIKITPTFDLSALLPMLDAGAALGARHVISAPYDDDLTRLADRLAHLSEASQACGMTTVLEFFPWTSVPDLSTCRAVVEAAGAQVGLLVDALHFDRSGSSHEALAAIPGHRLPFAHLCDAPVLPEYSTEDLLRTARGDRLAPGEGEIDLVAWLAALPPDTPMGLEVPVRETQRQGRLVDHLARIRRLTIALLDRFSASGSAEVAGARQGLDESTVSD